MIALILTSGGYTSAQDYLDRLMEACSTGNQKACDEIEKWVEANKDQLDKVIQRSQFFQSRSSNLAIQVGNNPVLKKTYRIIIKDYFASDSILPSHR